MRLTLVHPAGFNFRPGKPDITLLINRMAPTGLLQLAACLDALGHTTCVHDCLGPAAASSVAGNVELVLKTNPDLVAFTATTSAFLDGYEMATRIKEIRPDIKVLFGGPHVSAIGVPLLTSFPHIDYLCIGEGEGLIGELASGHPLKSIKNLVYREEDLVIANARRPRLRQLDDLPFPAYHKLQGFPNKYHLPLFSFVKRFGANMVTSRGCPHTCSFCDRTVFEQEYACNSAEYVWEHMRHLRDNFGVHHINFYDDLFTANKSRIMHLCETLASRPLGMDFNCAIRAEHANPTLLQSLKRAGCIQISVGVESGDPGLLSRHKSGISLEQVRNAAVLARAIDLRVKGLFIFGLPGETPETARASSDFIESVGFDEINISKFSPFHGAPIWKECADGSSGKLRADWRLMNCLNFTFVPNGFKSVDEMDFLYNQCIQRFYRGKHYSRLFRQRLWKHRWSMWHVISHLPAFLYAYRQFKPKAPAESCLDNHF